MIGLGTLGVVHPDWERYHRPTLEGFFRCVIDIYVYEDSREMDATTFQPVRVKKYIAQDVPARYQTLTMYSDRMAGLEKSRVRRVRFQTTLTGIPDYPYENAVIEITETDSDLTDLEYIYHLQESLVADLNWTRDFICLADLKANHVS